MTKKMFLVTGGAGFIGKHTVKALLDNNFNVVVADRKEQPKDLTWNSKIFLKKTR